VQRSDQRQKLCMRQPPSMDVKIPLGSGDGISETYRNFLNIVCSKRIN
jgi:hypothetical protein